MKDFLEVIPLGGLGEFGMNCTALRSGSEMILIDAGMTFPNSGLGTALGVQFIVPDITFLKENQEQLKAIVLTHGHEDHIGAVSFIIDEIPVPVYGSRLTLGLISARLKERKLFQSAQLIEMEARHKVQIGPFEIEPIHVTHSFPDAFSLAISTPVGVIIWSGDFKFDQTPVDRKLSDLHRLSWYGEQGVLALFSDSTNSNVPGLAPPEFSVYEPLRTLFLKAKRRIVTATFSSSINRIQVLLDLAREFGRKVAPLGRSMVSNIRTGRELGYLQAEDDLFINIGEVNELEPDKVLIIATGSQGEPMAALSRLAIDQVKNFRLKEEDIVILSARMIPGNEKFISNMINHLYRRGARVYGPTHSQVHVSGHGFREDLKLMINTTRPRFFIPIHGEFQQLKTHCLLAADQGISPQRLHLIENGEILRLTEDSAETTGRVSVGRRFIDEGIYEEVHEMVLRDRRFLSEDGFVVVLLRMDRLSGDLIGEPEMISRGFVLMETSEELVDSLRRLTGQVVGEATLEQKQDFELFNEILRKRLQRFLKKETGKRPLLLIITIEI